MDGVVYGAVPLLGLPRLKIYSIVRLEIWEPHSCERLRLSQHMLLSGQSWGIRLQKALRRKIKWIVWSSTMVVDPFAWRIQLDAVYFCGVTTEVGDAEPTDAQAELMGICIVVFFFVGIFMFWKVRRNVKMMRLEQEAM